MTIVMISLSCNPGWRTPPASLAGYLRRLLAAKILAELIDITEQFQ
jgi:hypothetical protein